MLILWLPPCIYDRINNAKSGECIWEPSLNKGFVIVVATIGHHGACLVMLFCYFKVFIFMRKHRRIIASVSNSRVMDMTVSTIGNCYDNGASTIYVKERQTELLSTSVFIRPENKECLMKITKKDTDLRKLNASLCTETRFQTVPVANPSQTNRRLRIDKDRRQKRDRAIFITLTYVVVGYAVCWIPFHVVFDVSSTCPAYVPRGVYAVTFWMTYINSTINPFLYNFSNTEFKLTFKRLLCLCKR